MEENNENDQIQNEEELDIRNLRTQWIYKTIIIVVIIGCIVGVASSVLTYYFYNKSKYNKYVATDYAVEGETTTAKDAIGDITEALEALSEVVDTKYIGEIEKKTLIDETIKGFIKGIGDEYSEYMTEDDWEEYQESALGNYSGVGIVMTPDDTGYILVTNVIKDSPAEKAGILQGDYIIGINDESIYNVSSEEVANRVRGETGTEVKLTILREKEETQSENEDNILDFTLTRETVRVYHVEAEMLEDNIGYVYFNTFDNGCADEFEKEMDKLVEQGAKKIVLDLRYNTGGAVDEALQILDLFLKKGEIEMMIQSANGKKVTISSLTDRKYNFEDIIILTNEYTASASEILTGALVDNGLAKTVGTKTYGKGVMQSVIEIEGKGILKLTTQEYTTPNDTKINGIGIEPNYEVEYNRNDDVDSQLEKAKSVLRGEE